MPVDSWDWADEIRQGQVVCVYGGRCNDVENLSIPKSLRTGTGAIRQESFMLSQLSAPQAQCGKHFA